MSMQQLEHEFNDGAWATVTRQDDETFPVIEVWHDTADERDRRSLARAAQKMLEPGERLIPMRFNVHGKVSHAQYTATTVGLNAKDEERLRKNLERGATGNPVQEGTRRWKAEHSGSHS